MRLVLYSPISKAVPFISKMSPKNSTPISKYAEALYKISRLPKVVSEDNQSNTTYYLLVQASLFADDGISTFDLLE
jgi:hypothetical protein